MLKRVIEKITSINRKSNNKQKKREKPKNKSILFCHTRINTMHRYIDMYRNIIITIH